MSVCSSSAGASGAVLLLLLLTSLKSSLPTYVNMSVQVNGQLPIKPGTVHVSVQVQHIG